MVISSLNQLSLLHDGTRHELTTFQFNVCKHSCSNRTSLSIRFEQQHRCDTILQVFSFKNKTKAKLKDIEAAYFVRTENIHPIFDKIKVGVSYRLCMRVFLSICAKTGPVYREICHCHMFTVTHAMKYMCIYFVLQLLNCKVIFVLKINVSIKHTILPSHMDKDYHGIYV